jgi:hypothetical protein
LDRSAARIVDLLNEDPDPAHAASLLADRFGISRSQALTDVGGVIAAVKGLSAPRISRGRRPTIAGVRVVTRSWWHQSWRYRFTTVEVALVVMAIEVGLKVTDLSHLARWLGVPLATDQTSPPALAPDDLSGLSEHEIRLNWAIHWVMARWLYDGTCLRRALAFGWFVRRHHPVLRLGMLDHDSVIAHAWVEVDGKAFNAQPMTGVFVGGGVAADRRAGSKQLSPGLNH